MSENPADIIRETRPDIEFEPWQREVLGMWRAINIVHAKATGGPFGFEADDIFAIHKKVLNDPFNPHFAGTLRKAIVKIGSTVRGEYREAAFIPVHPNDLPQRFGEFVEELERRTSTLRVNSPVGEVVETASWVHTELIRLHPFIEGNGRTARLLVDLIFKKSGLPYITDWGAENDEYKDVVDRTFKEDPNLFRKFLAEKLLRRTTEIIRSDRSLAGLMATVGQNAREYLKSLAPNAS